MSETADTPTPAPSPKVRRPLRRRLQLLGLTIGFCLVVLVILVLIAEWILSANPQSRLAQIQALRYLYEDDGDGVVLSRQFRGSQTINGRTVALTTNNLGLRRPDDLGPKAAGERRVLVLGDSMVFGQGVEDGETFCAELESLLSAPGRPVRVGNGGMTGASVADQLPMLRRQLAEFEPDLVLSCIFLGNDFTDALVVDKTVVDGYPLTGAEARLARESWRFRLTYRSHVAYEVEFFLFKKVPALALEFPPRTLPLELPPPEGDLDETQRRIDVHYGEGLFMDRVGPASALPAHVAGIWQLIQESLSSLRDTAAPVPVAVVIIPSTVHTLPGHYRQALRETGLDPEQHARGTSQRRIAELAARLGLESFDLTPSLRQVPGPESHWIPDDRHLSPKGHAQVARWLRERVQAWLDD